MTENGTQTLELANCVSLHFAERSGHSLALPAADCDFIFYCWVSELHICGSISITTKHHAIDSMFFVFLPFRILTIIYLKHSGEEQRLIYGLTENSVINNDPLVKTKLLGLNLGKYGFQFEFEIDYF